MPRRNGPSWTDDEIESHTLFLLALQCTDTARERERNMTPVFICCQDESPVWPRKKSLLQVSEPAADSQLFYLVNWLVLRSRSYLQGQTRLPGSNNSLSPPIASLSLNFANEWKDRQKERKGKSLLCSS